MRWKGNCFILLKATYVKSENDSPVGIKKKKKWEFTSKWERMGDRTTSS